MKLYLFMIIFLVGILPVDDQNESKLIIDASPDQTNVNPLIRLRTFFGSDMLGITSDHPANSFIGSRAGEDITTGSANTGMGNVALANTKGGSNNTGLGAVSSANNPEGNQNTAIGTGALTQTLTASVNTSVGYLAGYIRDFGWNNVFVGANTDSDKNDLFNIIAIGQGTLVTSSSTVRFGNSATGSYGGWANWTNVSDGRFKKNIKPDVPGLDFILKLNPVTYQLDFNQIQNSLKENQGDSWNQLREKAIVEKEKIIQSGFIAQEVEKIAAGVGYEFSGVDAPKNSDDYYGLRYAEFVVPLVKSVQELNHALMIRKMELQAERKILDDRLNEVEKLIGGTF
ncbi:MAG: tail fiber domain-containing protein [Saprospiraceae bacterium]|nr:tail fiber domain-containing protein [Saprospiraceae bacterium]